MYSNILVNYSTNIYIFMEIHQKHW